MMRFSRDKWLKTRVTRKYDRRIKLTEQAKEEIRKKYKPHEYSYQQLADEYGVSKRTIIFIVNPEKLEQNKEQRKMRGGWKQYYDKKKWRQQMREHRSYMKKLMSQGKI